METAAVCANCHASVSHRDQACPSCGKPLTAAAAEDPHSTIGEGIVNRHEAKRPSVKKSARWLLYLSVMFAVFGTITGMHNRSEAIKALESLDSYDDTDSFEVEGQLYTVAELEAQINREVWMLFGLNYLLAAVMLGLFFWARTNPYHAMLVGLGVYLGLIGLNAFDDPATLFKGIFLKVLIIGAIVAGIRAAHAERAEAAKLPRATLT